MKAAPLSQRLAARAFALAVDPSLPLDGAAAALVRMARGSELALRRALRRVERDLLDRPSPVGQAAAATLRSAAASAATAGLLRRSLQPTT